MYRVTNTPFAISEVQRFLVIIAEREPAIPVVPVDGIYGEDTRIAVTEFQKIKYIPATGIVDKNTFELLFFEAQGILKEKDRQAYVVEAAAFPLKLGDSGTDVSLLNTFLRHLAIFYKDIDELPYGSFFSRETEKGVKIMQKVFRLTQNAQVNETLFSMLYDEIKSRESFKNFP